MQASAPPGLPLGLLDVLEQLPPDVLEAHLCRRGACQVLRRACGAGQALFDGTVTHLCLVDSAVNWRRQLVPPLTHHHLAAWHDDVQRRGRTLQRLPRLRSLQLRRWPTEAALTTLLLRYGAACGARLKALALDGGVWGPGAMCAVAMACPTLQELDLSANTPLSGNVLLPLASLSSLTKLKFNDMRTSIFDSDALFSLGALTHLRSLNLSVCTLVDHPCLPALASLAALESLVLNSPCVIDDYVLDALRHLTRLSSLVIPHVSLAYPRDRRAAFPTSLRHFALTSSAMSVANLLSAALAFLPLAGLQSCCLSPTSALRLQFDSHDTAKVAQVASLSLASTHLAAAASIPVDAVSLTCISPHNNGDATPIMCAHVAEGLQPLGPKIRTLELQWLMVDSQCARLCDLTRVTRLSLRHCCLLDAGVMVLGAKWGTLRHLYLCECVGVTAEGWRGLAAVRGVPLVVQVPSPTSSAPPGQIAAPSGDLLRECQGLQESGFGQQHIRFV